MSEETLDRVAVRYLRSGLLIKLGSMITQTLSRGVMVRKVLFGNRDPGNAYRT